MGRDRGDISSRPSAAGFPPSHRHPTSGDFLLLAPFLVASYTAAGDMNLYRYVGNSSPNYTDPMGLSSRTMGPAGPSTGLGGPNPSFTTHDFGDPLPEPVPLPPEAPPGLGNTVIPWDPTPRIDPDKGRVVTPGGVYDPETGTYFPNPQTPTTILPGPGRKTTQPQDQVVSKTSGDSSPDE